MNMGERSSVSRAATYVDKILKGAARRPAVEQPTKFELVINLRPPRRSLTIPVPAARRTCDPVTETIPTS
jgi:hypothetical protein